VENKKMLEMARQFGFACKSVEGDAALREIVWRPADMETKPVAKVADVHSGSLSI
jgi:hypothetical protein